MEPQFTRNMIVRILEVEGITHARDMPDEVLNGAFEQMGLPELQDALRYFELPDSRTSTTDGGGTVIVGLGERIHELAQASGHARGVGLSHPEKDEREHTEQLIEEYW